MAEKIAKLKSQRASTVGISHQPNNQATRPEVKIQNREERSISTNQESETKSKYYQKMEQYKKENGICCVPFSFLMAE